MMLSLKQSEEQQKKARNRYIVADREDAGSIFLPDP